MAVIMIVKIFSWFRFIYLRHSDPASIARHAEHSEVDGMLWEAALAKLEDKAI